MTQVRHQVNISGKPEGSLSEIQTVRERLATVMIYVFAVLSLPSVILGVAKQVSQEYWRFIPFYLAAYAIAVLGAIFNKRLSFRAKAIGGILVMYLFATGILAKYGLSGAGIWVFTALCVLATMLFGVRFGLATVAASLASMTVVGALMSRGILPFDPDVLMNSTSGLSWSLAAAWFLTVAVVVVYTPGILLENLEASFNRLHKSSEAIEKANERLRCEVEERRRKEEELRRSEERYRLLAENIKDVIWTMDLNFRHTFISPSITKLSGSSVSDVMARSIEQHLTPDSIRKAMAVLAEAKALEAGGKLTSDLSRTLELEQYKNDGTTFWTGVNISPLVDANGRMQGFLGVTRDITAQHVAEQALRESEEKYRSLVEATDMGIFILQDGKLAFANEGLRKILGADDKTLAEMDPFDWMDDPSRTFVQEAFERWRTGKQTENRFNLTLKAMDKNTRAAVLQVRSIEYKGRRAIHGVLTDVTLQRSLEAQLQQSQKMEAIGRLAGGVAHDFNNLLTGIHGYTEILLQSKGLTGEQQGDLEQIRKAAQTAGRMTEQLLAFSRKQVIAPQIVDLNELIRRSQKMLGRLIGEDVELRYLPGDDVGHIMVDAHQIDQVLVNLAVNARDAMPEGGNLLIETFNLELDPAACRVLPDLKPGPYAVFSVTDTGCGIDPETQKLIFDPFFTTKAEGKGTGLGLATVYGIVRQNHGMITVHSKVGQGASFNVYLPRVEPADQTQPDKERLELKTGSETILLVEDEEMLRKLAQRILIMHGYDVLAADGGVAALDIHRNADRKIHLLMTDVIMPRMNGKELYEKIAAAQPDIKILYMSGHSEDVIARHGVLDAGIHFLPKPFTLESLSNKVRQVLDE